MISAAEARKIAESNTGTTVRSLLQQLEAKVKQAADVGKDSCYMDLPSVGWGVTRELKETLVAKGYQVSIGSRQGDTPHISLTW